MPPPREALLTALIADDEPIARQVLREELELVPGVEVIAEAENGRQALALIEEKHPDLVLLDLQMPGMGGFEVIAGLTGKKLPIIAIVTAYDQHAIQAFEAGAVDYLLKPVSQARLLQTVQRARQLQGNGRQIAEQITRLDDAAAATRSIRPPRVVGRSGEDYILLNLDEVFAFQAEGELVWIMTEKKRFLATQPLWQLEERLRHTSFHRIHRSALVNIDKVRKLSSLTSQRWLLTLQNAAEFTVSKRKAGAIREILDC